MRDSGKLEEFGLQCLRESDDGRLVAHFVAVIWSAEDSDALPAMSHFVPFGFNFVAPNDKVEIVRLQEISGDVRTKGMANT